MENCIFCKIVKGELPATKIYEDDKVLAFLDIAPVNIGHTLVIPKEHFVNIYETPEDIIGKMMHTAKGVAHALKKEVGADGTNITMNNEKAAGQVVFHAHIHIIPRLENDGFGTWKGKRGYNEGEASEIATKIIRAL
jgi:histidine triad (HIT) family protein